MAIANLGQILSSPKQIGGNAAETAVAKAYLIAHQNDFDRVDVEVKLGPGVTLGAEFPDYMQRWAKLSYALRADMICWNGNTPTIVECKDRIDGRAIGQLLTYRELLVQDNPTILQVYKVAAGVTILNGISDIFFRYGITVELFPSAWTPDTT
jgi:hypothetical protein